MAMNHDEPSRKLILPAKKTNLPQTPTISAQSDLWLHGIFADPWMVDFSDQLVCKYAIVPWIPYGNYSFDILSSICLGA